ncbi:hypothetical protein C5C18_00800 [Rathayibacter tritici]|nr:hypothetical protein C5C06_03685 [Rathayibacter tritici]PPF66371.1 hypothetical protein C5C21_09145 [Rathayibacter tritici]PPG09550.1 hypothetical protein C5C18_00800 [Rathayibacter tritici]PPI13638.1 hypothetical protein C5D07_09515 [Rathayibacter tritici]
MSVSATNAVELMCMSGVVTFTTSPFAFDTSAQLLLNSVVRTSFNFASCSGGRLFRSPALVRPSQSMHAVSFSR